MRHVSRWQFNIYFWILDPLWVQWNHTAFGFTISGTGLFFAFFLSVFKRCTGIFCIRIKWTIYSSDYIVFIIRKQENIKKNWTRFFWYLILHFKKVVFTGIQSRLLRWKGFSDTKSPQVFLISLRGSYLYKWLWGIIKLFEFLSKVPHIRSQQKVYIQYVYSALFKRFVWLTFVMRYGFSILHSEVWNWAFLNLIC